MQQCTLSRFPGSQCVACAQLALATLLALLPVPGEQGLLEAALSSSSLSGR